MCQALKREKRKSGWKEKERRKKMVTGQCFQTNLMFHSLREMASGDEHDINMFGMGPGMGPGMGTMMKHQS